MAIVLRRQLFKWSEIGELGDLERLKLVLDHLPNEESVQVLDKTRGKGRNDYPFGAMWDSIVAGTVFQHMSMESLRKELLRNGQLRQICGFDIVLGVEGVPSSSAYTSFSRRLMKHEKKIDTMCNSDT